MSLSKSFFKYTQSIVSTHLSNKSNNVVSNVKLTCLDNSKQHINLFHSIKDLKVNKVNSHGKSACYSTKNNKDISDNSVVDKFNKNDTKSENKNERDLDMDKVKYSTVNIAKDETNSESKQTDVNKLKRDSGSGGSKSSIEQSKINIENLIQPSNQPLQKTNVIDYYRHGTEIKKKTYYDPSEDFLNNLHEVPLPNLIFHKEKKDTNEQQQPQANDDKKVNNNVNEITSKDNTTIINETQKDKIISDNKTEAVIENVQSIKDNEVNIKNNVDNKTTESIVPKNDVNNKTDVEITDVEDKPVVNIDEDEVVDKGNLKNNSKNNEEDIKKKEKMQTKSLSNFINNKTNEENLLKMDNSLLNSNEVEKCEEVVNNLHEITEENKSNNVYIFTPINEDCIHSIESLNELTDNKIVISAEMADSEIIDDLQNVTYVGLDDVDKDINIEMKEEKSDDSLFNTYKNVKITASNASSDESRTLLKSNENKTLEDSLKNNLTINDTIVKENLSDIQVINKSKFIKSKSEINSKLKNKPLNNSKTDINLFIKPKLTTEVSLKMSKIIKDHPDKLRRVDQKKSEIKLQYNNTEEIDNGFQNSNNSDKSMLPNNAIRDIIVNNNRLLNNIVNNAKTNYTVSKALIHKHCCINKNIEKLFLSKTSKKFNFTESSNVENSDKKLNDGPYANFCKNSAKLNKKSKILTNSDVVKPSVAMKEINTKPAEKNDSENKTKINLSQIAEMNKNKIIFTAENNNSKELNEIFFSKNNKLKIDEDSYFIEKSKCNKMVNTIKNDQQIDKISGNNNECLKTIINQKEIKPIVDEHFQEVHDDSAENYTKTIYSESFDTKTGLINYDKKFEPFEVHDKFSKEVNECCGVSKEIIISSVINNKTGKCKSIEKFDDVSDNLKRNSRVCFDKNEPEEVFKIVESEVNDMSKEYFAKNNEINKLIKIQKTSVTDVRKMNKDLTINKVDKQIEPINEVLNKNDKQSKLIELDKRSAKTINKDFKHETNKTSEPMKILKTAEDMKKPDLKEFSEKLEETSKPVEIHKTPKDEKKPKQIQTLQKVIQSENCTCKMQSENLENNQDDVSNNQNNTIMNSKLIISDPKKNNNLLNKITDFLPSTYKELFTDEQTPDVFIETTEFEDKNLNFYNLQRQDNIVYHKINDDNIRFTVENQKLNNQIILTDFSDECHIFGIESHFINNDLNLEEKLDKIMNFENTEVDTKPKDDHKIIENLKDPHKIIKNGQKCYLVKNKSESIEKFEEDEEEEEEEEEGGGGEVVVKIENGYDALNNQKVNFQSRIPVPVKSLTANNCIRKSNNDTTKIQINKDEKRLKTIKKFDKENRVVNLNPSDKIVLKSKSENNFIKDSKTQKIMTNNINDIKEHRSTTCKSQSENNKDKNVHFIKDRNSEVNLNLKMYNDICTIGRFTEIINQKFIDKFGSLSANTEKENKIVCVNQNNTLEKNLIVDEKFKDVIIHHEVISNDYEKDILNSHKIFESIDLDNRIVTQNINNISKPEEVNARANENILSREENFVKLLSEFAEEQGFSVKEELQKLNKKCRCIKIENKLLTETELKFKIDQLIADGLNDFSNVYNLKSSTDFIDSKICKQLLEDIFNNMKPKNEENRSINTFAPGEIKNVLNKNYSTWTSNLEFLKTDNNDAVKVTNSTSLPELSSFKSEILVNDASDKIKVKDLLETTNDLKNEKEDNVKKLNLNSGTFSGMKKVVQNSIKNKQKDFYSKNIFLDKSVNDNVKKNKCVLALPIKNNNLNFNKISNLCLICPLLMFRGEYTTNLKRKFKNCVIVPHISYRLFSSNSKSLVNSSVIEKSNIETQRNNEDHKVEKGLLEGNLNPVINDSKKGRYDILNFYGRRMKKKMNTNEKINELYKLGLSRKITFPKDKETDLCNDSRTNKNTNILNISKLPGSIINFTNKVNSPVAMSEKEQDHYSTENDILRNIILFTAKSIQYACGTVAVRDFSTETENKNGKNTFLSRFNMTNNGTGMKKDESNKKVIIKSINDVNYLKTNSKLNNKSIKEFMVPKLMETSKSVNISISELADEKKNESSEEDMVYTESPKILELNIKPVGEIDMKIIDDSLKNSKLKNESAITDVKDNESPKIFELNIKPGSEILNTKKIPSPVNEESSTKMLTEIRDNIKNESLCEKKLVVLPITKILDLREKQLSNKPTGEIEDTKNSSTDVRVTNKVQNVAQKIVIVQDSETASKDEENVNNVLLKPDATPIKNTISLPKRQTPMRKCRVRLKPKIDIRSVLTAYRYQVSVNNIENNEKPINQTKQSNKLQHFAQVRPLCLDTLAYDIHGMLHNMKITASVGSRKDMDSMVKQLEVSKRTLKSGTSSNTISAEEITGQAWYRYPPIKDKSLNTTQEIGKQVGLNQDIVKETNSTVSSSKDTQEAGKQDSFKESSTVPSTAAAEIAMNVDQKQSTIKDINTNVASSTAAEEIAVHAEQQLGTFKEINTAGTPPKVAQEIARQDNLKESSTVGIPTKAIQEITNKVEKKDTVKESTAATSSKAAKEVAKQDTIKGSNVVEIPSKSIQEIINDIEKKDTVKEITAVTSSKAAQEVSKLDTIKESNTVEIPLKSIQEIINNIEKKDTIKESTAVTSSKAAQEVAKQESIKESSTVEIPSKSIQEIINNIEKKDTVKESTAVTSSKAAQEVAKLDTIKESNTVEIPSKSIQEIINDIEKKDSVKESTATTSSTAPQEVAMHVEQKLDILNEPKGTQEIAKQTDQKLDVSKVNKFTAASSTVFEETVKQMKQNVDISKEFQKSVNASLRSAQTVAWQVEENQDNLNDVSDNSILSAATESIAKHVGKHKFQCNIPFTRKNTEEIAEKVKQNLDTLKECPVVASSSRATQEIAKHVREKKSILKDMPNSCPTSAELVQKVSRQENQENNFLTCRLETQETCKPRSTVSTGKYQNQNTKMIYGKIGVRKNKPKEHQSIKNTNAARTKLTLGTSQNKEQTIEGKQYGKQESETESTKKMVKDNTLQIDSTELEDNTLQIGSTELDVVSKPTGVFKYIKNNLMPEYEQIKMREVQSPNITMKPAQIIQTPFKGKPKVRKIRSKLSVRQSTQNTDTATTLYYSGDIKETKIIATFVCPQEKLYTSKAKHTKYVPYKPRHHRDPNISPVSVRNHKKMGNFNNEQLKKTCRHTETFIPKIKRLPILSLFPLKDMKAQNVEPNSTDTQNNLLKILNETSDKNIGKIYDDHKKDNVEKIADTEKDYKKIAGTEKDNKKIADTEKDKKIADTENDDLKYTLETLVDEIPRTSIKDVESEVTSEKPKGKYDVINKLVILNKLRELRDCENRHDCNYKEYLRFLFWPSIDTFISVKYFPLINEKKLKPSYIEQCDECFSSSKYKNILTKYAITYTPSVSTVLNNTLPPCFLSALTQWKEKVQTEYGEEGTEKLEKENLELSSQFRKCVQKYISGTPLNQLLKETEPSVRNSLISLQSVFCNITEISLLDFPVVHSELPYHGIVDCVAKYMGRPVLITWKQADNPTSFVSSTYDAPVQLSAYIGALNFDNAFQYSISSGLIVVAYTDGSPAEALTVSKESCLNYWTIWLSRLGTYLHKTVKS